MSLIRAMEFIGLPVSFDSMRPALRNRSPKPGEHTDEFLTNVE